MTAEIGDVLDDAARLVVRIAWLFLADGDLFRAQRKKR